MSLKLTVAIGLIDVEVTDRSVILTASPAKGSPREEEALKIIDSISKLCERNNHPCERYYRNTANGDRLDTVEIYIYPRQ